jgi:segregation and condensation protein A
VQRADRATVAVTIYALLELYKQGELTWRQEEPFGEITISRTVGERRRGANHLAEVTA